MLTAHEDSVALPPTGFDLEGLDPAGRELIGLPLPALRERLDHLARDGNKDEQIYTLNLEYVSKDMEEPRVERLVTSSLAERKKLSVNDFLRAKVHLLHNEKLAKKLTGACVICKVYGLNAQEQELRPGSRIHLGRYEFRVDELTKGGRKGFRLGLSYERVPSPLFLKRLVPGGSVRLEFGDQSELDRAARALGGSPDEQGLALQLPSDGGVHSLRTLLDRLDAASIEVDAVAVRSPDLDDVFLSLTGRRDGQEVPTP
jgi:hypothetical protein